MLKYFLAFLLNILFSFESDLPHRQLTALAPAKADAALLPSPLPDGIPLVIVSATPAVISMSFSAFLAAIPAVFLSGLVEISWSASKIASIIKSFPGIYLASTMSPIPLMASPNTSNPGPILPMVACANTFTDLLISLMHSLAFLNLV